MLRGSLTIFVFLSQLKAKNTASDDRFSLSFSIDPKKLSEKVLRLQCFFLT